MKKAIGVLLALLFVSVFTLPAAAQESRLGGGVNYWRAIDDVDEDFDEDGISWLVSYQYCPSEMFRIEADLEIFPDGVFGRGDTDYAPQAFAILGSWIYAGVGAGIYYFGDPIKDWADDPFYVLRAGLDLEVLPDALHLDIYGRYQFSDWGDIDVDTDTAILGGCVRFEF
ncbi:MAG TPA: hypothetical protein P5567_15300 [Kiritimatiellia bacterium]|nr:hypothetical protein [Kiritimatiellia bacterium]HRZ13808.1 hypothetical protein [Kiritimatiellia bacterium]HSA19429.1 hypothetical protein [Kiritimatiellia bacterium]